MITTHTQRKHSRFDVDPYELQILNTDANLTVVTYHTVKPHTNRTGSLSQTTTDT